MTIDERKDHSYEIKQKLKDLKKLLEPYSTPYNGLVNWAKRFDTIGKVDYMDILRFRCMDRTFHLYNFQKFDEYGKPERTEDLLHAFGQLVVEYPETFETIKLWSGEVQHKKDVRRNNEEMNKAILQLDADFTDIPDFVRRLNRATGGKVCVNHGSTSISVYTWNPRHVGRYRTSNRIVFIDTRRTVLNQKAFDEALATIEERWTERE